MSSVFVELGNTVVIDDSRFSKLPFTEKQGIVKCASEGKLITFVESFIKARHVPYIKASMMAGEDVMIPIQLLLNRELTTDEANVISQLRDSLALFDELVGTNVGLYEFDEVPKDESIENYMWTKSTVRRQGSSSYSITFKQLEKLWDLSSPYWAGLVLEQPKSFAMTFSGYHRAIGVSDKLITIGCQSIKRWELEQIAKRLGFKFPK